MKKNKLAIVKPAAINLPATTPPPRKEDIINALVERAMVKHQEEYDKLEAKRATAIDAFNTAILAELTTNRENFECRVSGAEGSWKPEVEFRLNVMPPRIQKLREAVKAIPRMKMFDAVAVKRQIREGIAGQTGDLVKALLANPDAVRALDATLEQLNK